MEENTKPRKESYSEEDRSTPLKTFFSLTDRVKQNRFGNLRYQLAAAVIAAQMLDEWRQNHNESSGIDATNLVGILMDGEGATPQEKANNFEDKIKPQLFYILGEAIGKFHLSVVMNSPNRYTAYMKVVNEQKMEERLNEFLRMVGFNVLDEITDEWFFTCTDQPKIYDTTALDLEEIRYLRPVCMIVGRGLAAMATQELDHVRFDGSDIFQRLLPPAVQDDWTKFTNHAKQISEKLAEVMGSLFGDLVTPHFDFYANQDYTKQPKISLWIDDVENTQARLMEIRELTGIDMMQEPIKDAVEEVAVDRVKLEDINYLLAATVVVGLANDRLPADSDSVSFPVDEVIHGLLDEDAELTAELLSNTAAKVDQYIRWYYGDTVETLFVVSAEGDLEEQPVVKVTLHDKTAAFKVTVRLWKKINMDGLNNTTYQWFEYLNGDHDEEDEEDPSGLLGINSPIYPIYPVYLATDMIMDRMFQLFYSGQIDWTKNVNLDITDIVEEFLDGKTIDDNQELIQTFVQEVEQEYVSRGFLGFMSLGFGHSISGDPYVLINVIVSDDKWRNVMNGYKPNTDDDETKIDLGLLGHCNSREKYPLLNKMMRWAEFYKVHAERDDSVESGYTVDTDSFYWRIVPKSDDAIQENLDETREKVEAAAEKAAEAGDYVITADQKDPEAELKRKIACLIQDQLHLHHHEELKALQGDIIEMNIAGILAMLYVNSAMQPEPKTYGEWYKRMFTGVEATTRFDHFMDGVSKELEKLEPAVNYMNAVYLVDHEIVQAFITINTGITEEEDNRDLARKVAYAIHHRINRSYSFQLELKNPEGCQVTVDMVSIMVPSMIAPNSKMLDYVTWFNSSFGEEPDQKKIENFVKMISDELVEIDERVDHVTMRSDPETTLYDFVVVVHGHKQDMQLYEFDTEHRKEVVAEITQEFHDKVIAHMDEILEDSVHPPKRSLSYIFRTSPHGSWYPFIKAQDKMFIKELKEAVYCLDPRILDVTIRASKDASLFNIHVRIDDPKTKDSSVDDAQKLHQLSIPYGAEGEEPSDDGETDNMQYKAELVADRVCKGMDQEMAFFGYDSIGKFFRKNITDTLMAICPEYAHSYYDRDLYNAFVEKLCEAVMKRNDKIEKAEILSVGGQKYIIRVKLKKAEEEKVEMSSEYGSSIDTIQCDRTAVQRVSVELEKKLINAISNPKGHDVTCAKLRTGDEVTETTVFEVTDIIKENFPNVCKADLSTISNQVEQEIMSRNESVLSVDIEYGYFIKSDIYASIVMRWNDFKKIAGELLQARKDQKKEMEATTEAKKTVEIDEEKVHTFILELVDRCNQSIELQQAALGSIIGQRKNLPFYIFRMNTDKARVVTLDITEILKRYQLAYSNELGGKIRQELLGMHPVNFAEVLQVNVDSEKTEIWIYVITNGKINLPAEDGSNKPGIYVCPHPNVATDTALMGKVGAAWDERFNVVMMDNAALNKRMNEVMRRMTEVEIKSSKKEIRRRVRKEINRYMKKHKK